MLPNHFHNLEDLRPVVARVSGNPYADIIATPLRIERHSWIRSTFTPCNTLMQSRS